MTEETDMGDNKEVDVPTLEPDTASSNGREPGEKPAPPHWLRAFAIATVVIGPVLAYLNARNVIDAVDSLRTNTIDKITLLLVLNVLIYYGVGLFFVAGGLLLTFRLRWGRIFSLLAAVLCFVGYLISLMGAAAIATAIKTKEIKYPGAFDPVFELGGSWTLWGATMAFAIIVIVMLTVGIRKWAKRH